MKGYSDIAYTNAGCDDQIGPQDLIGAFVRAYACAAARCYCPDRVSCCLLLQVGLGVRIFLPDTNTSASLWSVTNISIPLSRTSVSRTTTLDNYELVFYGASVGPAAELTQWHRHITAPLLPAADNLVPEPKTPDEIAAFQYNVVAAAYSGGNPNAFYPLPGAKLFTAQFANPSVSVGTSVAWYTLTLDTAFSCPQLPKNAWVWMQLVPRGPIVLAAGTFYSGVRWLGAQNFLYPDAPDPSVQPWGIGWWEGADGSAGGRRLVPPLR